VNIDITKLIDQTAFLLEKQRDSKKYCSEQFEEFLDLVEEEISSLDPVMEKDKVEKLKAIAVIVREQLLKFDKEINEDITFLEEQLGAIQEIKANKDPVAAAKLLKILMNGEEVPDTKKFKEEVEAEAYTSKESFVSILNDLKAVLQEGGLDELLVYLQDLNENESEEEEEEFEINFDSEEDDESEDCCEDEDSDCCGEASATHKDKKCCGKGDCGKDGDCGDSCKCDD